MQVFCGALLNTHKHKTRGSQCPLHATAAGFRCSCSVNSSSLNYSSLSRLRRDASKVRSLFSVGEVLHPWSTDSGVSGPPVLVAKTPKRNWYWNRFGGHNILKTTGSSRSTHWRMICLSFRLFNSDWSDEAADALLLLKFDCDGVKMRDMSRSV